MLKLCALGGAALTRDGTPLVGAAAQHRRLALLTVIASAGEQGISRDSLLALLWPESPEDRARHALSQWLFLMRRDLGVDDLISGSHTLRLNAVRISTDVSVFDIAIATEDWSAAVTQYRGPLLDGLLLSNAPEFQHWLDRERDKRRLQALRAIEQLARASELTDPVQAVGWWQRLATLDPHSGTIASKVIRLLAANGDTVAALAFAHRHEEMLRTALELSPSAEVAALIDGLRGDLQSRATSGAITARNGAEDPYLAFIRDRLASRYIIDHLAVRNSLTTSFSARVTANQAPVTVNVFVPDLLARTDRDELLRLLEAAAAVRHRNIDSPNEVATVEGIVYFVVAGERDATLRDRLSAAQPLPIGAVIEIGSQMAAGLTHAHECGVVHGNLTPRRVVLHADGARLTELGVLPALTATVARMPHDSGFPAGTPSYMSPEQLTGDEATKVASDVYSLGCILYQMLTGQPPHAGSTARANLTARLREPAAAMGNGHQQRPNGLDGLVAAMLARAPRERPTAFSVYRTLTTF